MKNEELSAIVNELQQTLRKLEAAYPGRPFTLDGHTLGSIGEVWVAENYDIELATPSTHGYDAVAKKDGRKVEIKATQTGARIHFSSEPEHLIVLTIASDGSFTTIYNGPGSVVWNAASDDKTGKHINATRVSELNTSVSDTDRL